MELHKKIIELLENNGFSVNDVEQNGESGYYVELNQSTPEGEDWWVTITYDGTDEDFIREFKTYADYFDVDEEVEIWVDSRGKNGVPSSIRALVEDAEWKEETLKNTADDLDELNLEFYALLEEKVFIITDDSILREIYNSFVENEVATKSISVGFLDKCQEVGCFDDRTKLTLWHIFETTPKKETYLMMLTDLYDEIGLTEEKYEEFEQIDKYFDEMIADHEK